MQMDKFPPEFEIVIAFTKGEQFTRALGLRMNPIKGRIASLVCRDIIRIVQRMVAINDHAYRRIQRASAVGDVVRIREARYVYHVSNHGLVGNLACPRLNGRCTPKARLVATGNTVGSVVGGVVPAIEACCQDVLAG